MKRYAGCLLISAEERASSALGGILLLCCIAMRMDAFALVPMLFGKRFGNLFPRKNRAI